MGEDIRAHYDRLAPTYDKNWAYGTEFLRWMTRCLLDELQLDRSDRVADVGAGTGIYAQRLSEHARSVTCIEPSKPMLEQIPDHPRLHRVPASAEDIASRRARLPEDAYEAIVVKEAIHHVADREVVLRGLASLLAPGGRLLVVMLPTDIDYPLFQAAHDKFRELQPDPDDIAIAMRQAHLTVKLTYDEFPLSFPTEQYLDMVRDRYMSLLSSFDDDELARGIEEIRRRYIGDSVEFVDRFAFVLGEAP